MSIGMEMWQKVEEVRGEMGNRSVVPEHKC